MTQRNKKERVKTMEKYLLVVHKNGKIQKVLKLFDEIEKAQEMLLEMLIDDIYVNCTDNGLKSYVYPVYYGEQMTWQEIEADNDLDEYHLDFKPVGDLRRYEVSDRVVEIIKENELKIERE